MSLPYLYEQAEHRRQIAKAVSEGSTSVDAGFDEGCVNRIVGPKQGRASSTSTPARSCPGVVDLAITTHSEGKYLTSWQVVYYADRRDR